MHNTKKKKIIDVITKGNCGGDQRYVFDLAVGLHKDQFETVVACGEQDGNTLQRLLNEKGVRVIKLKKLRREVKFFDELLKSFKIL